MNVNHRRIWLKKVRMPFTLTTSIRTPDVFRPGSSLLGSGVWPAYISSKFIERKMIQNPNEHKSPSTNISPSVDDQQATNLLLTTKPAAKHVTDMQVRSQNATRLHSSTSDYGRIEAAVWASDMYDICGGDGECNAYLGDGISITPDGHLVDD